MDECTRLIERLNALLAGDFGIGHATIQAEVAGACAEKDAYGSPLCGGTLRA